MALTYWLDYWQWDLLWRELAWNDNPLPLILSLSMSTTLNCQCALTLVTCFTFSHLLPRQKRDSSLAALCGSKDCGLLTASIFFCLLNKLSTNLPVISPTFTPTSIVTLILEFFNVTPITFQFLPLISHTFSGLLNQLSLIHLVSNLQNLIVLMSSPIL